MGYNNLFYEFNLRLDMWGNKRVKMKDRHMVQLISTLINCYTNNYDAFLDIFAIPESSSILKINEL